MYIIKQPTNQPTINTFKTMAAQATQTSVDSGNISVRILVNGTEPCEVIRTTGDGGGVVDFQESSQPYKIEITMKNRTNKSFMIGKASVGDGDEGDVTGVQRIHYLGSTTLAGYKPGKANNFVCNSLSKCEKTSGVTGPASDTSYFKIEITEFDVIPFVEPQRFRSFCSDNDKGGYDRGGGGGGYDRGGGGSTFRSLSTGGGESYSRCGTMKGSEYVPAVKTVTTRDTFTKINTHVFTIQIVCSASDAVKFRSNRMYQKSLLKNEQQLLSKATDEVTAAEKALRICQTLVDQARAKCGTIRAHVESEGEKFTSIYGTDPTHESHAGIFMDLE